MHACYIHRVYANLYVSVELMKLICSIYYIHTCYIQRVYAYVYVSVEFMKLSVVYTTYIPALYICAVIFVSYIRAAL